MKRPSLSLLVIFLSGLLFTSCYKNDLRALYDYWTNQVNLVGINSEDSSAVAILADNRGNRAYYVPSNQDAYFVFNLKNEKDYFIKARFENDYIKNLTGDDKFSWESQGDNGIYNDDIKIANKIKVIVPQKFLVKNEGETYNVKVAIESCGKGKPSATPERDFTDDINFTFTINTPPPNIKNTSLFKYSNNGSNYFGFAFNLDSTLDSVVRDNIAKSLQDRELTTFRIADNITVSYVSTNTSPEKEGYPKPNDDDFIGGKSVQDSLTTIYVFTTKTFFDGEVGYNLSVNSTIFDEDSYKNFYNKVWGTNGITLTSYAGNKPDYSDLYVKTKSDSSSTSEESGSKEFPFSTFDGAINYIKNKDKATADWRIFLLDATLNDVGLTIANNINDKAKSLTITTGVESGKTTLNGTSGKDILTIETTVPIVLDSLEFKNGQKGIVSTEVGANLTVKNCIIADNRHDSSNANFGCGVYMQSGTLVMEGSTVSNNQLSSDSGDTYGGGVYIGNNSSFTMKNCTITQNTLTAAMNAYGGGIYIGKTSTFIMDGGTISKNEVKAPNAQSTETRIAGGGGVYIGEGSTMFMYGNALIGTKDDTASGNKALCEGKSGGPSKEGRGGGIYVAENGKLYLGYASADDSGNPQEETALTGGIYGNTAINAGNFTGSGGGVYFASTNALYMASGAINKNSGAGLYYGGYVAGTGIMNGGTINENVRGICFGYGGTFTMNGGEICGNSPSGGVYNAMYGGTTFTMNGGKINGNITTTNGGGGVYMDSSSSTFTMSGGEIIGNKATTGGLCGGGIYVKGGKFTMTGGEISGNEANRRGGGVEMNGGTFSMGGGTISGNTIANGGEPHGMAVILDNKAEMFMYGSAAITNHTNLTKRLLSMVGESSLYLGYKSAQTDGTPGEIEELTGGITDNTCNTAVYLSQNCADYKVYMGSGNISRNSGRGVYIGSGTFTMNSGRIEGNGTATNFDGAAVAIEAYYDTVSKQKSESTFILYDGFISENGATGSGMTGKGGGVYLKGTIGDNEEVYARFNMNGGTITDNNAQTAGGVYIGTNGDFDMNGGTINGNISEGKGRGVYAENSTGGMYNQCGAFSMGGSAVVGNWDNGMLTDDNDVRMAWNVDGGCLSTIGICSAFVGNTPVAYLTHPNGSFWEDDQVLYDGGNGSLNLIAGGVSKFRVESSIDRSQNDKCTTKFYCLESGTSVDGDYNVGKIQQLAVAEYVNTPTMLNGTTIDFWRLTFNSISTTHVKKVWIDSNISSGPIEITIYNGTTSIDSVNTTQAKQDPDIRLYDDNSVISWGQVIGYQSN